MANESLDIVVSLINEASAELERIQGDLGELGNQADEANEKTALLSEDMKRGFAILGTAVAGATVFIGKFLIESAGAFEQTGIAFETMLGSAEAGQEMLEKLADFAAKTPFTLEGVESSAKQLLAMGITTDDLFPVLKSLGDVSAGLSVDMSRLALNLGQVSAQGKLTGREVRDFAVAGVPLVAALADQMGRTSEEITGMVSNGEIGFEEVKKALIDMTSEGGKFEDLMDKQSKTMLGIFSNLVDSIEILAREIGAPLVEELKPALMIVVDALQAVTDRVREVGIKEFIEENRTAITIFAGLIGGVLVGGLVAALVVLISFFGTAMAIGAAMAAVGAQIGLMITAITKLRGVSEEITEVLKNLIIAMWDEIVAKFESAKEAVLGVMESIQETLSAIWDGISQGILFLVALLIGSVIYYFETMGIDIVAVFQNLYDLLIEIWTGITEFLTGQLQILQESWQTVFQFMSDFFNTIFAKITSDISTVWNTIKGWFDDGTSAAGEAWDNMWSGMEDRVLLSWEIIKEGVKNGINWIIEKINSFIAAANAIASKASVLGITVPQMPEIPLLAKGGTITQSGSVIVGEEGPEMLSLPTGAKVTPLNGGGGGVGGSVNIFVNIDNTTVLTDDDIVEKIGDPIIKVLQQHAAVAS